MVSHFIKRKWMSWHSPSVFVQWRHESRTGYNKTKIIPFYITVKLIVLPPQRHTVSNGNSLGWSAANCSKNRILFIVDSFCVFTNIPDLFNTFSSTTRTSSPVQMSMRTQQFCMKRSNLLKKRL